MTVQEFQVQVKQAFDYGTYLINLAASKGLDTKPIMDARTQIETMLGDKHVDGARTDKLKRNYDLLIAFEQQIMASPTYTIPQTSQQTQIVTTKMGTSLVPISSAVQTYPIQQQQVAKLTWFEQYKYIIATGLVTAIVTIALIRDKRK